MAAALRGRATPLELSMPPKFHAHRDKAIRKVDELMAETVRHYPMVSGTTADPERDKSDVSAPLRTGGVDNDGVGGASQSWGARISSGKAKLHISRVAYPDIVVRRGDRFRALDRAGQPWFAVDNLDDRNHSRIIVELDEI